MANISLRIYSLKRCGGKGKTGDLFLSLYKYLRAILYMAGGKNSWLLPMAAGVAIGWFFSGTLSKVLSPIASSFNLQGGHVGYAYPAAASYQPAGSFPYHAQTERRSFDRSYDSWIHNTVNSLPSVA